MALKFNPIAGNFDLVNKVDFSADTLHVLKTGDTMSGNLTFSNSQKIIGGTSTTADLTLQTTSGVGASGADMHFLVGNNGATEALTILNSGNVGVGVSPSAKLHVLGAELRLQTDSMLLSFFNTAGNRRGYIQTTESYMIINSEFANNPLYLYQGSAARATITSAGMAMTIPVTTSAGGITGVGTQTLTSGLYAQSRLQNLISNGNGLLGNNYNFTSFTFDATELHGGAGSFLRGVASTAYTSDELIPVDPEKNYRLVGWAKSGEAGGVNFNAANIQYFGVAVFDIDGLNIDPVYFSKYPGSTETTLAVALNPGDPTMTLTDATGWSDGSSINHAQFVWWPYLNSKSYSYPNYTYSRNTSRSYSSNSSLKTWTTAPVANVITLRVPWAGPALPIGTPVRNSNAGGTYKYIAAVGTTVPNTWTKYEGYIGTIDTGGVMNTNQFPYGTAYVKLLFLVNYHGIADNNIRWSDIWFSEMSTKNLEFSNATPTAYLHLKAGTATANTAPLKFTTGTSLSVATAGAMEFTTDDLFFTITTGTARKRLLMADPVGGLTSGRVPFATTNGRLTDDADMTFATDTLTVTKIAATTFTGDVTLSTRNIVTDTTTGTKIGTATTQKLGFFNSTPIVKPSAYTQTYSTADKTHADLTSADIGAFTGGTEGFLDAAERDNIRTQINALRADLTDVKQLANSLIDDLQALGLVA